MIHPVIEWCRSFWYVDVQPLSRGERWRSSLGGFLFIGIAGFILAYFPAGNRGLLASVGASAVILYALPHSPAAAPWSLVGGYMASTFSALLSLWLIPYPPLAAAFAVGGAIWLMARLKCVHPPGGSLALLVTFAAPQHWHDYRTLGAAIAANTLLAAGLALLINRGILHRPYPQWGPPNPSTQANPSPAPLPHTLLLHEDLDYAFRQVDTFVDVDETELVTLFDLAVNHAHERQQTLVCSDLMSPNPVTISTDSPVDQAWSLLQKQPSLALPVVDTDGVFRGLLSQPSFFNATSDVATPSWRTFIPQGLPFTRSTGQPQSIAHLMDTSATVVYEKTPFPTFMETWSTDSSHPVTVLDSNHRVIGIISQRDIIQALYRERALGFSPAPSAPLQPLRVSPA